MLPGALAGLLLMISILHDLKDPKLWELWYIPEGWFQVQGLRLQVA